MLGIFVDMNELYGKFYNYVFVGDVDCGGFILYNYILGEFVIGFVDGRLLFVCFVNDKFNFVNFMCIYLYVLVGVFKIGNDIFFNEEKIKVDRIIGYGGLFKMKGVG